ncbi:MAG: PEBP family protein, partial [Actinomycetia bacterium]|nr:PEBP family protein [Actinomycetes bacterium]
MTRTIALTLLILVTTACGQTASTEPQSEDTETTTSVQVTADSVSEEEANAPQTGTTTFQAEVWADNWFVLYVNGALVGEDSVPITTERSFNSESFTFEATYPLTIAIEAKDFKEDDSGLEYIGEDKQQMGDGGIIAQITDNTTGEIVAATDGTWSTLIIHRAPLNPECEKADNPI